MACHVLAEGVGAATHGAAVMAGKVGGSAPLEALQPSSPHLEEEGRVMSHLERLEEER